MLFKQQVLDGITSGEVDLAFRNWRRPTVKVGTQIRTPVGVVAIDAVDVVDPASIADADARRAGFATHAALMKSLRPRGGTADDERAVYRIALHLSGPDPRVALRERADLTPEEVAEIDRRLARLDKAGADGAWTSATLRLIADRPGTRAGDLAVQAGRPRDRFKADVRKLKELGLTESLGTGYRLSPRGSAFLDRHR